jgi:DNA-binding beta-propeller fold protein YncE
MQIVGNLDGFKRVHGVLAVPEIGRAYASVTGGHQVAAVDMAPLKTIATTGPVTYPDGIAYSPATKRVFVSDEHGGGDAVIDTGSNKLLTRSLSVAEPATRSAIQVWDTSLWQCMG